MNKFVVIVIMFMGTMTTCFAEAPQPLQFQKGAVMKYELTIPREGFAGAPSSPRAVPDSTIKPTKPEHFEKRFVMVTFLEDSSNRYIAGRQITLRIDGVKNGDNPSKNGLYFAYINITNEGVRVVCRFKNDHEDWDDTGTRYGIPFPFTCSIPIGLHIGEENTNGYIDHRNGRGVAYRKMDTKDTSSSLQVEATRFVSTTKDDNPRKLK